MISLCHHLQENEQSTVLYTCIQQRQRQQLYVYDFIQRLRNLSTLNQLAELTCLVVIDSLGNKPLLQRNNNQVQIAKLYTSTVHCINAMHVLYYRIKSSSPEFLCTLTKYYARKQYQSLYILTPHGPKCKINLTNSQWPTCLTLIKRQQDLYVTLEEH